MTKIIIEMSEADAIRLYNLWQDQPDDFVKMLEMSGNIKKVSLALENLENQYFDLDIYATEIGTEIWIGDNEGNFVEKGVGKIRTRLLSGEYTVSFGLNGEKRLLELKSHIVMTED